MAKSSENQSGKALVSLRNLILDGEVKPGQKLSEVALAERLGISRTPVRNALLHLSGEGLLEKSGSSYAVRHFSIEDVLDSIELRGTVEGLAARLAAERGADLDALEELSGILDGIDDVLADGAETLELPRYSALNDQFHNGLAALCGSRIIQNELTRAIELPFASHSAFVKARLEDAKFYATLVEAQTQHRAILDAIAHREGARAEALMREHARIARRNFETVLEDKTLSDQIPVLKLVAS